MSRFTRPNVQEHVFRLQCSLWAMQNQSKHMGFFHLDFVFRPENRLTCPHRPSKQGSEHTVRCTSTLPDPPMAFRQTSVPDRYPTGTPRPVPDRYLTCIGSLPDQCPNVTSDQGQSIVGRRSGTDG